MTVARNIHLRQLGATHERKQARHVVRECRGKEIFEFEFEPAAISNVDIASTPLDPRLTYFPGHNFRVSDDDAFAIMEHCVAVVRQWRKVASALKIPLREQNFMASAFQSAE